MAISRLRSRAVPLIPLLLLFVLAPSIYPVRPATPSTSRFLPARTHTARFALLTIQSGLKAVNKIGASSEPGEHVSFVTVFTTYSSDPAGAGKRSSDALTVGKHSYGKEERSMAILNTFISFIQVSMPRSDVIILTDPKSKLSINQGRASILPIEGNYSRGNLMLQRIKSYIVSLSRAKLEEVHCVNCVRHFVFTDSDMAVVEDLGHIFTSQPLNSGFVAVRGTRDGISNICSVLPCEVYNWTQPEGAGQFHGMPLDLKVVHFKGSRKRLMLEAWDFYNSTSQLSDMLCLILKSGRTKYDF
ncbi:hypothetical protein ZWY2020_008499 [Hordeum vulgare]|nr:hypothetical protein ZWY2020_008499 [Hordeum vulgare]